MPEDIVTGEFVVDTKSGLLSAAEVMLCPNRDARPDTCGIDMIVLHGISLPPGEFGGDDVEALFHNRLDWDAHPYFDKIRGMKVSAHLFVRRDGSVKQFVPFKERAWHAGESRFRSHARCNDFSIGIELEGVDTTPYDERQYRALTGVIRALMRAYPGIDVRTIAAHSDIAPGRKTDPGPAFDWLRLYDALGESIENNAS